MYAFLIVKVNLRVFLCSRARSETTYLVAEVTDDVLIVVDGRYRRLKRGQQVRILKVADVPRVRLREPIHIGTHNDNFLYTLTIPGNRLSGACAFN